MPEHLRRQREPRCATERRGNERMAQMNMIQALNSAMDIMMARDPSRGRARARTSATSAACSASPTACSASTASTACSTRRSPRAASSPPRSAWRVNGLRPVAEIQFADYIYPGVRPDRRASSRASAIAARASSRRRSRSARPAAAASAAARRIRRVPEAIFTHVVRHQGRDALEPLRREGPADRGDRGRRPGDLLRAEAHLQRPVRRRPEQARRALEHARRRARCPTATTPCRSARPRSCARARRSRSSPTARWCTCARPRRRASASTPRSSTCARWCRSTSTRSALGQARPAAASSRTRRRASPASARSSPRPSRKSASGTSRRPIQRVAGWDTPYPHAFEWEYFPGQARVADARCKAVMEASMSRYVFKMPDLGEGTVAAEVVAWHVKVGDLVKEDQIMAEVMTDKAAVEMPAPVTGRVLSITGAAGRDGRGRLRADRVRHGCGGCRGRRGRLQRRIRRPRSRSPPLLRLRRRRHRRAATVTAQSARPRPPSPAAARVMASPATRRTRTRGRASISRASQAPGPSGRITREDLRVRDCRARRTGRDAVTHRLGAALRSAHGHRGDQDHRRCAA